MEGRRSLLLQRKETVRLMTAAPVSRESAALLSTVVSASRNAGIDPKLLLTLLLQECQFYHSKRGERLWTALFLALRELPSPRLRGKSFGMLSIKPRTAQELIRLNYGVTLSMRRSAMLVACDVDLALRLAARTLSSFCTSGGSDMGAFLSWAANPQTSRALLDDPDRVVQHCPSFRARAKDYEQCALLASTILARCDSRVIAAKPSPSGS